MAPKWKLQEDEVLIEIYPNNSKAAILAKITKPWTTITRRALRLGLHRDSLLVNEDRAKHGGPRSDSWKPEEYALLKEIFEHNTKEFIIAQFKPYGRSSQSIFLNALKLGLERDPEIIRKEMLEGSKKGASIMKWPDEKETRLKQIYESGSKQYIMSQLPGETWKAIREHAVRQGLRRNPDIIINERNFHNKEAMKVYGVEYSTQLPRMKERSRQTNLERRGVEYPSQSAEVREKVRETVRERYGVDNILQAPFVKQKLINRNPLQNEDIHRRVTETNLKRYGVENPFQMTDRIREGMLDKYGQTSPQRVPEIRKRTEETNIQRYGGVAPVFDPKVRKATEKTNLERYGFSTPLMNLAVKRKIVATNLQRYGVTNPAKTEVIKDKIRETTFKKFGIYSFLQLKEIREKAYAAIKKNKSFNKSKEEERFLKFLRMVDFQTQHQIEHPETGFIIDFYMPNYNLWVQYDGIYWHGKIKRLSVTKQSLKILRTMERDAYQNEHIPNLIRFWSDEALEAISNETILQFIRTKVNRRKAHGL